MELHDAAHDVEIQQTMERRCSTFIMLCPHTATGAEDDVQLMCESGTVSTRALIREG